MLLLFWVESRWTDGGTDGQTDKASLLFTCLSQPPVCPIVDVPFLFWVPMLVVFVSACTVSRSLHPPSTINYPNNSLQLPPSMLLYFLTGNLSVLSLWPPATLQPGPGNLYSTPGFAPLSNLSPPNAGHFLVTMKYFCGRADVITFLFVPHLPGHSLQENELYNTKGGIAVLQSTWGQFGPTGLGCCLKLVVQLKLTC